MAEKRKLLKTPGVQKGPTSKTRAKKLFGKNTARVVKKLQSRK